MHLNLVIMLLIKNIYYRLIKYIILLEILKFIIILLPFFAYIISILLQFLF